MSGRATAAAVVQAVLESRDLGVSVSVGTVTAWSTPKATVSLAGVSVPGVRVVKQARADIAVGVLVLVVVVGSVAVVIGTLS